MRTFECDCVLLCTTQATRWLSWYGVGLASADRLFLWSAPVAFRRVALETPEWTSRDSNHHRQSVSAGKTNAIPTEPSGRLIASADRLPVVVQIPAGPLGSLKCDPPKGNRRRPQKNLLCTTLLRRRVTELSDLCGLAQVRAVKKSCHAALVFSSLNVVVDNSFWHVFECDAVVRPLCPECFCLGSCPFLCVWFAVFRSDETQIWLGDLRVVLLVWVLFGLL